MVKSNFEIPQFINPMSQNPDSQKSQQRRTSKYLKLKKNFEKETNWSVFLLSGFLTVEILILWIYS